MAWHRAGVSYCSNVHAGETVSEIEHNLDLINRVRQRRDLANMHSGLWLSCEAAKAIATDARSIERFQDRLEAAGLRLCTLNGFPYGGFHDQVVKARVYQPTWAEVERLEYTRLLAELLAVCLPADEAVGTISTLPLGFRPQWSKDLQCQAARNLATLARDLAELEQRGGKHIRVCLEMEPACALETTTELVDFFRNDLAWAAQEQGIAEATLRRYLGVCYDICHQAVMFEDLPDSLNQIHHEHIGIGKIQISSALSVKEPGSSDVRELMQDFAEPRYLHQVCTLCAGRRLSRTDLAEALTDASFPRSEPWRVHFHVPVQAEHLYVEALETTRADILSVFVFLAKQTAVTPHLEVETYTWNLLPGPARPANDDELIESLAAELGWVEEQLATHGLLKAGDSRPLDRAATTDHAP